MKLGFGLRKKGVYRTYTSLLRSQQLVDIDALTVVSTVVTLIDRAMFNASIIERPLADTSFCTKH